MRAEAHVHIGRARKGLEDCISVRNLPNGHVYYEGTLQLTDATFSVQPAGLRRFRETRQKNVHAFVRGKRVMSHRAQMDWDMTNYREAGYNPNVNDTFVDKAEGFPVHRAAKVVCIGKRVFYQLHAS